MSVGAVVAAILLLVANAFFVAVEFALVASRGTKLAAMAEEGNARAARALESTRELSLQLAGAQLGITIASLLLGYVAEPAVSHALEEAFHSGLGLPEGVAVPVGFGVGLLIVVFLHMVLGEMVPKNIAIAGPERTLLVLDLPNRVYLAVFRPVIWLLNTMASGLLRVLGLEAADEISDRHTSDELADLVSESRDEGLIHAVQGQILRGALAIGEAPIGPMVVPRDRIAHVGRASTVAEAEAEMLRTGHSRLVIVGDGGLDDVLGLVHAKDLLIIPASMRDHPLPLGRIRRLPILHSDAIVDDVLLTLQHERVHLALVTDHAGRTIGVVALEDVLEELVGDIIDETDRES